MMKTFVVFFAFAVAPSSKAFVPITSRVAPSGVALRESIAPGSIDNTLARLEKEYQDLQNELMKDLIVKKDKVAASEIAETMLEKAVDTAAVQKYKQQQILDEAHGQEIHSRYDILQARAIEYEAHSDAMSAEHEAQLLESIGDAYEDLERLRDLSVAHAAHHLEEDARNIELESKFKELEAESKEDRAVEMIKQLDQNLVQLKESLKQLRETKRQSAQTKWKENDLKDFLKHQPMEE